MIPASVVALAGGAPPRLLYGACQVPLIRGDPGGRMAGTDEDDASRSVLSIEDAKSSGY